MLHFLVQLWLPNLNCVRLDFLQAILEDKKLALPTEGVKQVNVNKHWLELAPKNAWASIKDDEGLHKFLPCDIIERGVFTDRSFFWGVCMTLRADWTLAYIQEASTKRSTLILRVKTPRTI